MSIEEIKLRLMNIPGSPDRKTRAEHTLELLRMQKKKVGEEMANLKALEKEIDFSLEKVNQCLGCKAKKCREQCPSIGSVL